MLKVKNRSKAEVLFICEDELSQDRMVLVFFVGINKK